MGSRLAPGPNEQKWRQRPDARWTTTRLTRPIPASPSPCPASVHLQHRLPYNHQHVPCASWSQERHARDRNRPYVLTSTRAQSWGHRTGGALRALPAERGQVLVGSLGGVQEVRSVARELEAEGVSTRYCKVWEGAAVPACLGARCQ